MIWQRSVVAKEKVRTIEVNDYATKEEVSDLKDSIGEQIKKYLPLSGGTMDKGSNISFPVDYGNTQNTLLVGGRADYGSFAGLAGFLSSSGSGFVVAHVGFRCLTLIS